MNAELIAVAALARIFVLTSSALKSPGQWPVEIDAIREEAREAMLAIKHEQDRRNWIGDCSA
jgi:hypothetical protein